MEKLNEQLALMAFILLTLVVVFSVLCLSSDVNFASDSVTILGGL